MGPQCYCSCGPHSLFSPPSHNPWEIASLLETAPRQQGRVKSTSSLVNVPGNYGMNTRFCSLVFPLTCSFLGHPSNYYVFVLGSGESGKTTIVKQMRVIHQDGFTDKELMSYRPTIYRNTLDSAQAIILAMRKIGLDCIEPINRVSLTLFQCRARPHLRYHRAMQILSSTTVSILLPPSNSRRKSPAPFTNCGMTQSSHRSWITAASST